MAFLGHGLPLMPMTGRLFDAATDGTEVPLGFWRLLPLPPEHVLAPVSAPQNPIERAVPTVVPLRDS
jgi:hypothetical protein